MCSDLAYPGRRPKPSLTGSRRLTSPLIYALPYAPWHSLSLSLSALHLSLSNSYGL